MMNVAEQAVADIFLEHGTVFHQSSCGTKDTGQWCPQVMRNGTQQIAPHVFLFFFQ